jgi:hypothetical protein
MRLIIFNNWLVKVEITYETHMKFQEFGKLRVIGVTKVEPLLEQQRFDPKFIIYSYFGKIFSSFCYFFTFFGKNCPWNHPGVSALQNGV